ncbi:unnamed protein product [Darwinula stevensoni]|uniref:Branched-chain-amino-acid aminotransferase n=1 Tax=Darwinula stevensoni TaxID=69355 RepID=A0A7R9AD35_9CRUS|nr:unnamed protein product [Darwinula stevensoni]CAG0900406.1 unnamed protein product [Darwinula stevensoni]
MATSFSLSSGSSCVPLDNILQNRQSIPSQIWVRGNHLSSPNLLINVLFSLFSKASDLQIQLAEPEQLHPKPDPEKLTFGKHFTDHMLSVEWSGKMGWGKPYITPLQNISLHPGAKVFHYAIELFEGMKAHRGIDERIRLFRPDQNMMRMISTSHRSALPGFSGYEFLKCLKKLIWIDQEWVPHSQGSSLYIRPTFIGTDVSFFLGCLKSLPPALGVARSERALLYVVLCPVGPYFATGMKPVSLLADPMYVRAWPGGCGDKKVGSNYGPTIYIQKVAEKMGVQQILWLFGNDHQLTEVGTMNIFVYLINDKGEKELVTPPLDGLILPGVTRRSLLEMARSWSEFKVSERRITMKEVVKACKENRLLEIFGAGTACIVCPVNKIYYQKDVLEIPTMDHPFPLNQRFLKDLQDIQYGQVKHPWAVDIEDSDAIMHEVAATHS